MNDTPTLADLGEKIDLIYEREVRRMADVLPRASEFRRDLEMVAPTYQPSRWERLSAPVSEAWRRIKGAWYVLTTGEEWYCCLIF